MNNSVDIQKIISDYELSLTRIILFCLTELPFPLGIKKTISVLKGVKSTFNIDNKFNKLFTFSLLSSFSSKQLKSIIEILISFGLIKIENVPEHEFMPILKITDSGKKYMEGKENTQVVILDAIIDKEIPEFNESERILFSKLRTIRHNLAEEKDLPAYTICSDQVLREICLKKPDNRNELLGIKGIGEKFIINYGDLFLEEIKK
jgi:ATP-dependent DNA helicase RecQ